MKLLKLILPFLLLTLFSNSTFASLSHSEKGLEKTSYSARKLGKTTKEAISKFANDIKLIAGNQVGAVGGGVDDLVKAAGKSTEPVENMSEFFSGSFGSVLKNSSSKTSR